MLVGTDEFSVIGYITCIGTGLLRHWVTQHVIKYHGRICVERECGIGV